MLQTNKVDEILEGQTMPISSATPKPSLESLQGMNDAGSNLAESCKRGSPKRGDIAKEKVDFSGEIREDTKDSECSIDEVIDSFECINKDSETDIKGTPPPTCQHHSCACRSVPTAQVRGATSSASLVAYKPKTISNKRYSAKTPNVGVPPTKRPRHLEHQDQISRVIDRKYVQFLDCKTKNASIKTRHEDLQSNMLSTAADRYYKHVQIVHYNDGSRQLQTPCACGRTRTFSHRRAIRKGVAITFFKVNKCKCGHAKTHQLLMCFCGALFRSTNSLYACPCFNQQGPAFAMFPNYSEFAARGCPCPVEPRRHCRCISTASL